MDRKTIIGVVIALAILFTYPYYIDYVNPQPEPTEESLAEAAAGGEGVSPSRTEAGSKEKYRSNKSFSQKITKTITSNILGMSDKKSSDKKDVAKVERGVKTGEQLVTVETPLYRAVFSTIGGGVRRFELKKHKQEKTEGSPSIDMVSSITEELPLETALHIDGIPTTPNFSASTNSIDLKEGESAELLFVWVSDDGVKVTKKYQLSASTYAIDSELEIANGSRRQTAGSASTLLSAHYGEDYPRYHSGPVLFIKDKAERIDSDDDPQSDQGRLGWIGLEDKFFLLALLPESDMMLKWDSHFTSEDDAVTELSFAVDLKPGYKTHFKYSAFLGPKEYSTLIAENKDLGHAIEFGFFSFMAKPTLVALNFFQRYLKNYGIAIILLTVIIKILFYPLTKKSFTAMKDMQQLQPQMKAIKAKYKEDKQKQNKEIMDLYKRHKVNPVGGCLPMVLQIPVFIALYEVLSVAIELRHAPFMLWLTDLSAQDPYYITPLLMGATMFLQQKMTPSAMDPMQQKMMLMMPIVFTFLFLKFPSGLVIYWLVNNILTIAQQYKIHKTPSKTNKTAKA